MDIANDIISSNIYNTQDGFNFEIVNFHFLDGHIPHFLPTKYVSSSLFFERVFQLLVTFNNKKRY